MGWVAGERGLWPKLMDVREEGQTPAESQGTQGLMPYSVPGSRARALTPDSGSSAGARTPACVGEGAGLGPWSEGGCSISLALTPQVHLQLSLKLTASVLEARRPRVKTSVFGEVSSVVLQARPQVTTGGAPWLVCPLPYSAFIST